MTTQKLGPCSRKQQLVLQENEVDILLTGGGAGGGKTMMAFIKALKYVSKPHARVLIMRRTVPLIMAQGGLYDEATQIYLPLGATLNIQKREFRFPNGSSIKLASMPKNIEDVKGWQPTHVIIDEATEDTMDEVLAIFGRIRSAKYAGPKMGMILTCNPDRMSWLYDWVEYCLDEEGVPKPGTEDITRWFVNLNGKVLWGDSPEHLYEMHGAGFKLWEDFRPNSFKFIPMTIDDNPLLDKRNPGYRAKLLGQSRVNQLRFLHGSWTAMIEGSSMVEEHMFEIVDYPPAKVVSVCRGWDLAASVPNEANKFQCDWTVGVKMSKDIYGTYYIEDVVRFQRQIDGVLKGIIDAGQKDGEDCYQILPTDPAQAGKVAARFYAETLASAGVPSRKDDVPTNASKRTRFSPFASVAPYNCVKLVKGEWNKQWLAEVCSFKGDKMDKVDDQVDATATAFNCLSRTNNLPRIAIYSTTKPSAVQKL